MSIILCGCTAQSWICNPHHSPFMGRQMPDEGLGGPAINWPLPWPYFHHFFSDGSLPSFQSLWYLPLPQGYVVCKGFPWLGFDATCPNVMPTYAPEAQLGAAYTPSSEVTTEQMPRHAPTFHPANVPQPNTGVWTWIEHQLLRTSLPPPHPAMQF